MFSKLDELISDYEVTPRVQQFAMNASTHAMFVDEIQKIANTVPRLDADGVSTYRGRRIVIDEVMSDGEIKLSDGDRTLAAKL